jgi:hypothetical protein
VSRVIRHRKNPAANSATEATMMTRRRKAPRFCHRPASRASVLSGSDG